MGELDSSDDSGLRATIFDSYSRWRVSDCRTMLILRHFSLIYLNVIRPAVVHVDDVECNTL